MILAKSPRRRTPLLMARAAVSTCPFQDEDTKMNKIRVSWTNGLSPDVSACPADCSTGDNSCICPISVEFQTAFDAWKWG